MKFIVAELIQKKRDGFALSETELHFLVQGFANGSIPDYQISAWLMATYFKGMSAEETVCFTREMKNSGDSMQWRSRSQKLRDAHFADKHSTGGVGDKVSLILAPVAACLGLKVPMMSGPGLGFTGGTVDKLLSISGFKMKLSSEQMTSCLEDVSICMMSQSEKLCPSDRKLYSLRDVTATVESLPLITGSIVSKKWAAGVENIVYDVKCGTAAFMTDIVQARELAQSLVRVSKLAGMKASALITRMDEPLGAFVGNALEVREALFILKNKFPEDFHEFLAAPLTQLSCRLAAEMAHLAGLFLSVDEAYQAALLSIQDGRALAVFEKMMLAQGADPNWQESLPTAPVQIPFRATNAGTLKAIHSRRLGFAGIRIGAGRAKSSDIIDPATGFEIFVSVGQKISKGQILCLAHLNTQEQMQIIENDLLESFEMSHLEAAPPQDLVLEKII